MSFRISANCCADQQVRVEYLRAGGLDLAFCALGESCLAALDGFYEVRDEIEEDGVTIRGDAVGELMGWPKVCFVPPERDAANASAAEVVRPDRIVAPINGDGCLLMYGQGLATAGGHAFKVAFSVVDGGIYASIRIYRERSYPDGVSATALRNLHCAALDAPGGAVIKLVMGPEGALLRISLSPCISAQRRPFDRVEGGHEPTGW